MAEAKAPGTSQRFAEEGRRRNEDDATELKECRDQDAALGSVCIVRPRS